MTEIYIRKFFLIGTVLGITVLTLDIGAAKGVPPSIAGSTLAFGFLLLFAFLWGRLSKRLGAPMITGFLLAGALAGPYALDIVTESRAAPLKLVDSLALTLIAISAGGELKISRFKKRIPALFWTAVSQTAFTFGLVFSVMLPALAIFGIASSSFGALFSSALLLGVIATANSPATAIAVITETRAKGPVSDAIIGVTVIKDVLVIILFGFALAIADGMIGTGAATGFGFLWLMVYDVAISISAGAILGRLAIYYLESTKENVPLFLLGLALVMVEITEAFGISPLMAAITCGFVVENISKEGERLIEGLQTSSLPVFVIFFSLAGQSLDFESLKLAWPVATLFVVVRMIGARIGTIKGMVKAGEKREMGVYTWTGFIGQAGVTLGFASMMALKFPDVGGKLATLVVAAVAINQIVGPVLMKRSLIKAGEVGKE